MYNCIYIYGRNVSAKRTEFTRLNFFISLFFTSKLIVRYVLSLLLLYIFVLYSLQSFVIVVLDFFLCFVFYLFFFFFFSFLIFFFIPFVFLYFVARSSKLKSTQVRKKFICIILRNFFFH